MPAKMTAEDVCKLLARKHEDDVFVPECKTGATWAGGYARLDAWAMKKSWSDPLTWGYEIKVARSDFLGDNKWHTYLEYCNEFYFVCPRNLIADTELPPEVGLLYVADTGTRLYTKKKAQRRTNVVPEELYRYLLMSRAIITAPRMNYPGAHAPGTPEDRLAYWRRWLEERADATSIGYKVSAGVREYVDKVEQENRRLTAQNEALEYLKQRLTELGIKPGDARDKWPIDNALRKLVGEIPFHVHGDIQKGIQALQILQNLMKKGSE